MSTMTLYDSNAIDYNRVITFLGIADINLRSIVNAFIINWDELTTIFPHEPLTQVCGELTLGQIKEIRDDKRRDVLLQNYFSLKCRDKTATLFVARYSEQHGLSVFVRPIEAIAKELGLNAKKQTSDKSR